MEINFIGFNKRLFPFTEEKVEIIPDVKTQQEGER